MLRELRLECLGGMLTTRDRTSPTGFVWSKRLPLEMFEWLIHCW
jgi:hypothetical protein